MFFRKSVDGVLSSLNRVLEDLESIVEQRDGEIAQNLERINELEARIASAADEQERAARVKSRLEELLA